ncbi:MAG: FkbM family methyltransferase [Candidatus Thiodubiliella endoseptemdiera]|uniref:FkbM family methyltransferase n=1 Tax=Candidatus Thiodubiliella endoseptemdiera TaxID=2738886 RepID=A0A853F4F6_9GAMM|nr:FkbM family methyltransferase [Candidatus Thiodubiliella endoseptemdiera]
MNIKHRIKRILWKFGYDVSRFDFNHPIARRKALLKSYDIQLVLDVGANIGQFSEQMRQDIGYTGAIISFEPLSSEFKLLKEKVDNDKNWKAFNCALGDIEQQLEINIAGNSYSSSILDMLKSHEKSAPESKYIGQEIINVKTLDGVMSELSVGETNIYLKIDTQGFESKVLKGAEMSLDRIHTIQLEMSLVPLYKDELLFDELYKILSSKDYVLVSLEPGFSDSNSGQMLQLDGIFHRF